MFGLLLHVLVSENPDCRSDRHGDQPGHGKLRTGADLEEFNTQGYHHHGQVEAAECDKPSSQGNRFLKKKYTGCPTKITPCFGGS